MIVEFIGSTGAGKTTLISEVQHGLANVTPVTTSFDLIAAPLGLRGITHPTARNLIQEVIGLPFLVLSLRRHKAFITFALRMLARQASLTVFTLNNLRSLVRKLGMYEIIRRYGHDRIVLVDEGTVLSTHNVFVYSDASYTPEEIAKFANLMPLPDVIVYVKAPAASLVKRTLQRRNPPRELRSEPGAVVEKYVNRAVTMFEQLVQMQNIKSRVLIVENLDSADQRHATTVNSIAEFVLSCQPSAKLVERRLPATHHPPECRPYVN